MSMLNEKTPNTEPRTRGKCIYTSGNKHTITETMIQGFSSIQQPSEIVIYDTQLLTTEFQNRYRFVSISPLDKLALLFCILNYIAPRSLAQQAE